MSTWILPLDSPDATLDRVGGKGANLAELARAGFAVPAGFLVTTDAYRAFVAANQIAPRILELARAAAPDDPAALERVSEQIRALFAQGDMPGEIAAAITKAYQDLPRDNGTAPALAVRSSATAEDLPGLSFAGQQDTYLNIVGADTVLDAVRRCWGSLWTARAIGYRARNGIAPDNVALAVVAQKLVASEVSGVLFTANPLTGRRDEIVIDASFGLGEAIVSGQVEPDHYEVDPHTWRITSRKIGAKALAIVPRAGGGTDQVAGGAQRQALSDAQILELARLSWRVAEHFGSPQDIEWAWAGGKLHLLQSRPITSLYPLPEASSSDGPRVYWSFGAVQGVIDPFTPLGRDFLRAVVGGVLRVFRVPRPAREIFVTAGGRLFIDITDISGLAVAAFTKIDPVSHQTLRRLMDEGRVTPRRPGRAKLRELLPGIVPALGRILAALQGPEFMRARAIAGSERVVNEIRGRVAAAHTLRAQVALIEDELPRSLPRIAGFIAPVLVPGIGSMLLIDRWLVDWLHLPEGSALRLMRGLPGNVTTEMDLRLWAEVQTIRADREAREFMLARPAADLAAAYERGDLPPVAQRAIARFMDRYGMRGVGEIDLGRPRWRDDPTPLIQTVCNYLRLEDPERAPDAIFARGAAEAERQAAEWVAQLRATPGGGLRVKLLAGAIRRMRMLAGMRESPKFYIIQTMGIFRAALLESGRDLAARGALEQADDIFFVPLDQLRRFADGEPLDLKATVARERAEYEREQGRRRMPRLLLSTGETFYEGLSESGASDLVGDAVSPGVAEGRAHVVLDPRGVQIEPGEILVCPATDPGWTPLFLTVGGLVMEVGGMVTHGSVVAREYGIPAVVGVHQATSRLRTGQRIRVDGTQGRVTVLEDDTMTR